VNPVQRQLIRRTPPDQLLAGFVVFRTAGRPSDDRVFSLKSTDRPKAVEVSVVHDVADVEALAGLPRFRDRFYECLTARRMRCSSWPTRRTVLMGRCAARAGRRRARTSGHQGCSLLPLSETVFENSRPGPSDRGLLEAHTKTAGESPAGRLPSVGVIRPGRPALGHISWSTWPLTFPRLAGGHEVRSREICTYSPV
jgi:hypothetical protein